MFTKEDVRKVVYEGIKKVKGNNEITIGDNETFADYGLDSLDQMNLLLEMEMPLGVKLDDLDLDKSNTINSIHDFVNKKHK